MKALTFDPAEDQFQVADLSIPTIGTTDVLVRVEACGLNPVDAKIRLWKSQTPNMDASWVGGLDVSGRIAAIGPDVGRWKIGDRILCHGNMYRPHGGFAEYTVQDSQTLIPHPQLSPEIAAATPCAGWTAWRALNDKLRANEHDSILITGGSGGVGSFAIQLAKYFGLKQIIVTCTSSNQPFVTDLGATHVIDYRSENVVDRVLEITNHQGVSIGLDTVGRDNDRIVANSLKFEGQMVEIVDTVRPTLYKDAFSKGLSFHQLSLGAGHRNGPIAKTTLTSAGNAFSALVEQGIIIIPALETIPLHEVGDALNEMLKQRTIGKIVMTLPV